MENIFAIHRVYFVLLIIEIYIVYLFYYSEINVNMFIKKTNVHMKRKEVGLILTHIY